jgi:hypothetical protein
MGPGAAARHAAAADAKANRVFDAECKDVLIDRCGGLCDGSAYRVARCGASGSRTMNGLPKRFVWWPFLRCCSRARNRHSRPRRPFPPGRSVKGAHVRERFLRPVSELPTRPRACRPSPPHARRCGQGALVDDLDELEAQSIFILREAYRRIRPLGMLWSIGKDSTARCGSRASSR